MSEELVDEMEEILEDKLANVSILLCCTQLYCPPVTGGDSVATVGVGQTLPQGSNVVLGFILLFSCIYKPTW